MEGEDQVAIDRLNVDANINVNVDLGKPFRLRKVQMKRVRRARTY
jgi:hypothetical protein